jgi:hypothetical protein
MKKTTCAIVGILMLWCCFAPVQGFSLTAGNSPSAPATSPPAGQSMKTSGQRQPMTDIHDIKSLVRIPVPVSLAAIALWAGACIIAAALLAGGWFLWKRRHGKTVLTVEAVLSPEDTALQRLAALSGDIAGDGKAFYFKISAIFREYLRGRFGIDGPEMTTEELLPHVETMALERDIKREIKKFLVSSDPVKFAGVAAHRTAMENDLTFVKAFVERTAAAFMDATDPIPDASE